VFIFQVVALKN